MPRPRRVSLHSPSVALSFGSSFVCIALGLVQFVRYEICMCFLVGRFITSWFFLPRFEHERLGSILWVNSRRRLMASWLPHGAQIDARRRLFGDPSSFSSKPQYLATPRHKNSPRSSMILFFKNHYFSCACESIQIWIWYFAGLQGLLWERHY
jgi:hypothetical protein